MAKLVFFGFAAFIFSCAPIRNQDSDVQFNKDAAKAELRSITETERLAMIKKGRIWWEKDSYVEKISSVEIKNKPEKKVRYAFNETVNCRYVDEKDPAHPDYLPEDDVPGGMTPKFMCRGAPDDDLKIKYDESGKYDVQAGTPMKRLFSAGNPG